MPFLFKLESPNNHIAGGGYFIKYEIPSRDLALGSSWSEERC